MNINQLKKNLKNQIIAKSEFIDAMHTLHKVLLDFSDNLKNTEIKKIEIDECGVFFTSRSTDFHNGNSKFFVNSLDKRGAPIEAFNFENYEREESKMIFNLITDGDIVFDIGANIGWYSIHLAAKFPNCTLHAFEPIPDTFALLKRNLELNRIENIQLNNLAFSANKEKLKFYYSLNLTVAASSRNITGDTDVIEIECLSDTIDNYVTSNKIKRLDFIKCDVEGAEYFVFQGGREMFKNLQPIVFTEMLRKWAEKFEYHPNEIIDFFSDFGYLCFTMKDGKITQIRALYEHTLETNFIFLHTVKHKKLINKLSSI